MTRTTATTDDLSPELLYAVLGQQAVKRELAPDDIAAAVAYHASDAAGAITGQSLRVDGGLVTL